MYTEEEICKIMNDRVCQNFVNSETGEVCTIKMEQILLIKINW